MHSANNRTKTCRRDHVLSEQKKFICGLFRSHSYDRGDVRSAQLTAFTQTALETWFMDRFAEQWPTISKEIWAWKILRKQRKEMAFGPCHYIQRTTRNYVSPMYRIKYFLEFNFVYVISEDCQCEIFNSDKKLVPIADSIDKHRDSIFVFISTTQQTSNPITE